MSGFKGIDLEKENGNLNGESPSDDNVMLLCCVVPLAALPAGTAHYTPYELLQETDADTYGFDAAFDANANLLVNNEVLEFFRISPNGKLYLMAVPDALSTDAVMATADFKQALKDIPTAKCIGFQGFADEAETLVDKVELVQAQVNAQFAEGRLIDNVIIGGTGKAGGTTAIVDYPDLRAKNAGNVQVSIAQDDFVAKLAAAYTKYAAVGAVLGAYSIRKVNENIGSVDVVNKPSAKKGDITYPLSEGDRWASANLSDGTPIKNLSSTDLKALETKGYILAGFYEGESGIYLNNSPTCVTLESDYSFGERNRTWNKAARGVKSALFPKLKGLFKKDPTTGYILGTSVAKLQTIAEKPLKRMFAADEISGYNVYINPKQVVDYTNPLRVACQVVSDGIIHDFTVTLGLANNV